MKRDLEIAGGEAKVLHPRDASERDAESRRNVSGRNLNIKRVGGKGEIIHPRKTHGKKRGSTNDNIVRERKFSVEGEG